MTEGGALAFVFKFCRVFTWIPLLVSFFDLFRYFSWKYLDIVQKSIEPRREWKNLTLILLSFLGACTCVDSSPKTCTLAPFRATSRPYKIKGVWYYPQQHYECEEIGVASWYGGRDGCHTLPTASGRAFDMFALTCAHKTLPLPCVICVTNLKNGRQAVLEVIDRGPFKYNRILDVSVAAAKELGFYQEGTATIHIKTLVAESLCLPQNQKALAQKRKKTPLFRQSLSSPAALPPRPPDQCGPGSKSGLSNQSESGAGKKSRRKNIGNNLILP